MSRRSLLVAVAVGVLSCMTVAGLIMAVILALRSGGAGAAWGGRIAVVEIDGVITDDAEILEWVSRIRDDRSIRGVLVAINSPGGIVGPTQSVYRELRRLREEGGRPVVATIGAIGASGGYYVALAADTIFALPGTITGSIGVVMEFPAVTELLEKVGVEVETVKSAEFKDLGSPLRRLSEQDRGVVGAVVQDVHTQFVNVVSTERKLSPEEVRLVADGRILTGRQALQAGLIDRIGNLHDARAAVGRMTGLGDDPRTVWPPRKGFTLLDLILGRGTTSSLASLVRPIEQSGGPRLKFVVPY